MTKPGPRPDNFLALEDAHGSRENAGMLILPVPLEATVSWGGGTADVRQRSLRSSACVLAT